MQYSVDVENVAKLSTDELDALLGKSVLDEGFGSSEPTVSEALAAGTAFFERSLPELRRIVCDSESLRALVGPDAKERNTLIAAIADLVTPLSPIPLVLAARIVHFGYDRLCPLREASHEA